MDAKLEFLESGEVARLIPVIADSRKEQRVASVFLASISAVPVLAAQLLSPLGVRLGKRSIVDTYTEIILKGLKPAKDRPDGLILVSSGKTTWKAIIEAKIGSALLEEEQVHRYLQLAREHGIDAVITISNQFAARPTHSPIKAPRTLTRRVDLFHWSWKTIVTEAILLREQGVVSDADQAFILREFVRFASHDSVGISGFDQMPKEWKDAVTTIKSGGGINKRSDVARSIMSAWHQECRDLALRLSQHLATSVSLRLSRAHAADPDDRMKSDCEKLANQNRLEVEYEVPNAASNIVVSADLFGQTIRVGMELDAPQDRKRGASRVRWLLAQLKNTDDAQIFVRTIWPTRARDTIAPLAELREKPDMALESAVLPPRGFEVFLLVDDHRRFAGRRTFIEELERAVPRFYDLVGQHLTRWQPKPPKPIVETSQAPSRILGDADDDNQDQVPDTVAKMKNRDEAPASGNRHSAMLELPDFLRRFSPED